VGLGIWSCEADESSTKGSPFLTVDIEELVFTAVDTEKPLPFTTNVDWSVEIEDDWCTVDLDNGDGSDEEQTIVVAVSELGKETERTTTLSIKAGKDEYSIIVKQTNTGSLSVSTSALTLDDKEGGDEKTFKITAAKSDIYTIDSDSEWLTTDRFKGNGPSTVKVYAPMNTADEERVGNIFIKLGDITHKIVVTQRKVTRFKVTAGGRDGILDTLVLSPHGDVIGQNEFKLTASHSWEATVDETWFSIEPESSTIGGIFKVKVSAEANTTAVARTGTITVTMNNGSVMKLPVVQDAETDAYANNTLYYYNYADHTLTEVTNGPVNPDRGQVVIVGDGFNYRDLKKGTGLWELESMALARIFYHMPVVRDLRDLLDVYIVMTESPGSGCFEGVGTHYGLGTPGDGGFSNRMQSAVAGRLGTKSRRKYILVGNGMVGGYAIQPAAVYSTYEGGYDYWMIHEFAGHVVGSMPDLYCDGSNSNMKDPNNAGNMKKAIDGLHADDVLGTGWMLDYSRAVASADNSYIPNATDSAAVVWKRFMEQPQYAGIVGLYGKGHYYGTCGDLLTPEPNDKSTMNGGCSYFLSPERYQLWKQIHLMAGYGESDVSLETFFEYDRQNISFYFETDESGNVLFDGNIPRERNRSLGIFGEWNGKPWAK
jgi:hypothetical protein